MPYSVESCSHFTIEHIQILLVGVKIRISLEYQNIILLRSISNSEVHIPDSDFDYHIACFLEGSAISPKNKPFNFSQ